MEVLIDKPPFQVLIYPFWEAPWKAQTSLEANVDTPELLGVSTRAAQHNLAHSNLWLHHNMGPPRARQLLSCIQGQIRAHRAIPWKASAHTTCTLRAATLCPLH